MPELPYYNRKARRTMYSRRCLHWYHIRRRKGLRKKLAYILNRLQGRFTVDAEMRPWGDLCIHRGDRNVHLYYPTSTLNDWSNNHDNEIISRSDTEA